MKRKLQNPERKNTGISLKNIARYGFFVLGFEVCFFACISCSQKSVSAPSRVSTGNLSDAYYGDMEAVLEAPVPEPVMEMAEVSFKNVSDRKASAASDENGSKSGGSVRQEQKLIYTGDISLEVKDLDSAKVSLENWTSEFDGYIANSHSNPNYFHFVVKIPCENFQKAFSRLGEYGKIISKNSDTQDVTNQYYDLETRIATKKIMLDRLEQYLRQAKDIKDMITIEQKINDITYDLESLQGQMKNLSHRIQFSTIDISVRLPESKIDRSVEYPDMNSSFTSLATNVLGFLAGLLMVMIYVILFGVPLFFIFALLYWLLFGKIGLIKKFFKKIK